MSRRKHKRDQALEVHVRFEVSHVALECLASAYEQIVPQVRSCTSASRERSNIKPEPTQQQVGGMHG